jgi:hypothetical protein
MLRTALSFFLAAIWVMAMTLATERLGSRRGGLLVTLPSTIIVALFFIGLENGGELAADTAMTIPAGMGVNIIFLVVFISTVRHGLGRALAASMAAWFLLAALLYLLDPANLAIALGIYALAALSATLWLRTRHRYAEEGGRNIKYRARDVLFRGVFAGTVIAIAVFMTSVGGPVLGSILSVFPAIFLSTMIILYTRQGEKFTGATGRSMIPGTVNVVVYAVAAYLLFPIYGAITGTVLTVIISYAWSAAFYLAVVRK